MDKLTVLTIAIAAICTVISVVTEFTKEIGFLKKIPTALQVLVTSIIVCEVTVFAYLSYAKISIIWYYPVGAFFAAFIIAIICTHGWEYLIKIWKRFYSE